MKKIEATCGGITGNRSVGGIFIICLSENEYAEYSTMSMQSEKLERIKKRKIF